MVLRTSLRVFAVNNYSYKTYNSMAHNNHKPVEIENRIAQPLPDSVYRVLETLFAGYQRLLILSEYGSGLSGSRVFLVRPLRHDGTPELRSVVKIDYRERIEREWHAYQENVRHSLPHAAEMVGEPAYPAGSQWGGLRYPLIGSGAFDIESLSRYYEHASQEELSDVLQNRLFRSLGSLWAHIELKPDLQLQSYYDDLLPYNLVITVETPPAGAPIQPLTPDTIGAHAPPAGSYVRLAGFRVVKIFHAEERLSLDVPIGHSGANRLHLRGVADVDQYLIDQLLPQPVTGRIVETRFDQLQAQVSRIMGDRWQAGAPVTLTSGQTLPDPITALPGILNQSFDAYVGRLHGDLNLENVLVELESRNAYLIDFARFRQDHVLRDLLQLEMAVITRLLPRALEARQMPAETIFPFYERLECAVRHPGRVPPPSGLEKPFAMLLTIRNMAAHYLYMAGNWDEYYYGLILYLIGALKLPDLDELPTAPRPKEVAFLGAAAILHLAQQAPDCQAYVSPQPSASPFGWIRDFFDMSNVSEHARSSWSGKALVLLGRLGLPPHKWSALFFALLLWIAAYFLITPMLRLPLPDDSERLMACVKFAAAGILLPLLIAAVTAADYQEKFDLTSRRQKLLLFRLKLTGALAGHNIFAPMLVALSLGVYYLNQATLPDPLWTFLLLVPLIFSHIGARRIPADRYIMFQNVLRAHEVDAPFLAVFIFLSSLLAFFLYYFYWFLSDALTGITFLFVLLGSSIWEQRHRQPQNQSDLRTILLVGFVIPLLIFLLQIFFNPLLYAGNLSAIRQELPALLLVSLYLFSFTAMWVTMWLRRSPQYTLAGLLRMFITILLLYPFLSFDRRWGLAAYVALIGGWILWRWRRAPQKAMYHPAFPILYLTLLTSLAFAFDSPLPIWLNTAAYALIAASCLWWVYRHQLPPPPDQ